MTTSPKMYCQNCRETVWTETLFGRLACQFCGGSVTDVPAAKPVTSRPAALRHYEAYAKALVERLYQEHYFSNHAPTVFRNASQTVGCATGWLDKAGHVRSQVIFYYQALADVYDTGMVEYASLRHLVPGRDQLTGLRGVHQIVLHEFAHVVAYHTAGLANGRGHGSEFIRAYKDLMILYPFEA